MKKILILVCVLAPVALAGCQTIREHNPFANKQPDYQAARQQQPLEVPPGMDQPPATAALAIPGSTPAGGTNSAAPAAQPEAAAPPAVAPAVATPATAGSSASMTLSDTPDSAWHRVGLALARGDAGQVTSSDAAARTYQVAVNSVVSVKSEGGFLHRMFHRTRNEAVQGTVTVSVAPSGSGSVVSAQGNPDAAARVIEVLRQRLQ